MDTQNDNQNSNSFDFEKWMTLAKEDPQAFEEQRKEIIQKTIDGASDSSKKRLQGIQWQIDNVREQSGSPMAACMKISQMMWDNVQGEDGLLDQLNQLTGKEPIKQKEKIAAPVVKLERPDSKMVNKTGLTK